MRLILVLGLVAAALAALVLLVDTDGVSAWAAAQQRAFQTDMARAVRALQTGQPGAWTALLAAAGAYGFVHALGPGHGKFVIGGVGMGTSVSARRLLGLALASSLAQALWAIVLVYGGFALLALSARRMTALAEDLLAPASFLAIACVGLVLAWRGLRSLAPRLRPAPAKAHAHAHEHAHHHHDHDHGACGCHAHGPSPEAVARVSSWREALALIASIAIRPCTGAIFLLVIAWQMEILAAGAAAVAVMGMGTALLTSLVALSSTAARGLTWASADRAGAITVVLPALQMLAGLVIVWMSLVLLGLAVI
ncbi:nickel/cobalt transporter [Pseudoponticoccus marisrubri]|uniref:Nickel/cobalt efflux system n=1 Tax=Pseudoponticoccus marisrubri TaxID=1685382 RepID=A0A0W7WLN8_9RHOB|nr:hypothetical protein [Pseudoponticoccus marisrubri]KUF11400.1 hypothetical protein AVJ23_06440 [Pseudoponticoccus marisrubri]